MPGRVGEAMEPSRFLGDEDEVKVTIDAVVTIRNRFRAAVKGSLAK